MKNTLLNIIMVLTAACCCVSCIYDHYQEPAADENQVTLAFNMRLLGYDTRAAGDDLPAERIRSLRVVLVDLGISYDETGEKVDPVVEYNRVMNNVSVSDKDGVVSLKFPKIRADRKKKVYLLINAEQSYLDLKWNGQKVDLNQAEWYLPGTDGKVPIEYATFLSPKGSHSKNDIDDATAELLVPMTAFHSFSIPDIKTIENLYPLQTNMVYAVPDELYVVRAINKITFDFVNATKDTAAGNDGIELLVKEWSISSINTGASYLFAHPGKNGTLFDNDTNKNNHNALWMQWLEKEAGRSQSDGYEPQWLTEYDMPADAKHGEYSFAPADPQKNEGYILPKPTVDKNTEVTFSTENDPVYFAESRSVASGPQQYELAFTVMQKENGEWNNEYTYRATSSPSEWADFNLQSLFRSTYVKVTVTFRSGIGHPDFDIDVHPYGSYELEPDFGL